MSETPRPTLYYLFPDGDDFKIIAMTDFEALRLWVKGERWIDMPKKTRSDAEQLRLRYKASPAS